MHLGGADTKGKRSVCGIRSLIVIRRLGMYSAAQLPAGATKCALRIPSNPYLVLQPWVRSSDILAPAEAIIETAKADACDRIVMGSHGRWGIARPLLGSQATKVVTLSSVPVLVCR